MALSISDPTDWKIPEMKEMDRLLRCPICFDFYQTPMMLPCSHSFCSLCIRRYLQHKSNCPSCMKPTNTSVIVNNLVLGEICLQFSKSRGVLLKLCQTEYSTNKHIETADNPNGSQSDTIVTKHIVPMPPDANFVLKSENLEKEIEQVKVIGIQKIDGNVKKKVIENSFDLTPPLFLSQNNHKRGVLFGDIHGGSGVDDDSVLCDGDNVICDTGCSSSGTVRNNKQLKQDDNNAECPVCGKQIISKHINNHLDICLKYSKTREHTAVVNKSYTSYSPYVLPRLPKLCYTVMKDNELRQKLREYHLPSNGQRSSLISRLREFTLHYNAQCDSPRPKTVKEIATEVKVIERAKNTPQRKHNNTGLMKLNKKSSLDEVEVQYKEYAVRHTAHYDGLITGVRKRLLSCKEESVDKKIKISNNEDNT